MEVVLEHEEPLCSVCGRRMHVKRHRRRRVYTLKGPVCYVAPMIHCSDSACPNHCRTFGPKQELTLGLPRWLIGWVVFCWLGHRRFARHWSVPQLRAELQDSYVGLAVSYERLADTLEQRSLLRHSRKRSVTSACWSALVGAMIGACERQQGKCPLTA